MTKIVQPNAIATQPVRLGSASGQIGGDEGRDRHRRRDQRQAAVVEDEHVRRHRLDAHLHQGRRDQRRQQDVAADRRQAGAEDDVGDRREHEQQEQAAGGEMDQHEAQREAGARIVERADHDAGRRADHEQVDAPTRPVSRSISTMSRAADALALEREDEGEHERDGGGDQAGAVGLLAAPEQRVDQHDERDRKVPAGLEHVAQRAGSATGPSAGCCCARPRDRPG